MKPGIGRGLSETGHQPHGVGRVLITLSFILYSILFQLVRHGKEAAVQIIPIAIFTVQNPTGSSAGGVGVGMRLTQQCAGNSNALCPGKGIPLSGFIGKTERLYGTVKGRPQKVVRNRLGINNAA